MTDESPAKREGFLETSHTWKRTRNYTDALASDANHHTIRSTPDHTSPERKELHTSTTTVKYNFNSSFIIYNV